MPLTLRAQLERSCPVAARVFFDIDSPIALAFLERYPSPGDARSLGEKRLAGFLARHGYCGRRTPRRAHILSTGLTDSSSIEPRLNRRPNLASEPP